MWEIDFSWEGFEWISNDDYQQSVISFMRMDKSGRKLFVVCNFCPVQRDFYRIGIPEPGDYKEVFNSEAKEFDGCGITNGTVTADPEFPMHGHAQSISLTLPPLSVMYFEHVEKPKSRAKNTADAAGAAGAEPDEKPVKKTKRAKTVKE